MECQSKSHVKQQQYLILTYSIIQHPFFNIKFLFKKQKHHNPRTQCIQDISKYNPMYCEQRKHQRPQILCIVALKEQMDNIYLTAITTLHWFLYAPATISSIATATIIHHRSVTKYLFTLSLYLNQSKCITIPIQKGDCREGDTK